MTESVRYIVTRIETLPKAACPSIPVTCALCGAPCWQSLVNRHHFHRIELTNYQAVCGVCDTSAPEDTPELMGAALPGIPRAQQFMPPRGHILKSCAECQQGTWVEARPYLYVIRLVPATVVYCDNCVSSCANCASAACG